MSQALYRKYRSKSLSEIVGQDHVTKTLERAIKSGRISHAYLLTGPKGVGKTSVARILAHEINNIPYTDESTHLDIIEIDAASNRRIDEIRDLRDKVHIAPTSAKYKVYIIDEVHMLTKEAFNALLKTLEEPPEHVIFILATTEVHKLPETIISRTQKFTFKAIEQAKAVEHMKNIALKEKIKIDDDAIELLALHGGGSFRDAIGLLDQMGGNNDKVTKQDVEKLIGLAPNDAVNTLMNSTLNGTAADIIESLQSFIDLGISPAQISKQLAKLLRSSYLEGTTGRSGNEITQLLNDLLNVQTSSDPLIALELSLFKVISSTDIKPITSTDIKPIISPIATPKIDKPNIKTKDTSDEEQQSNIKVLEESEKVRDTRNLEDMSGWWPELVNNIKSHNNTLYGILRMAHPELSDNVLKLSFGFSLHTKKVKDAQINSKINDEIKKLTGRDLTIEAVHNKDLKNKSPNLKPNHDISSTIETPKESIIPEEISAVTSIFGGGEVLET